MKANLIHCRSMDGGLFYHFPLLTQKPDFFAEALVLFLNVLMRPRHQIIVLVFLNPLIQRRKSNTQI